MIKRVAKALAPRQTRRGHLVRRLVRRANDQADDQVTVALAGYAISHPTVRFVQIGAHNGHDDDPLAPWIDHYPGWTGLMVEPVPQHFAALSELRGHDPRIRLVRAAITGHDGTATFYTIDVTGDMPSWASQLSSLHLDVMLKHEADIPALREHLKTMTVPAMRFATLVDGGTRIDLLCVHTEGHSAVILDQINLDRWRPAVVMYEHKHLSAADNGRCRIGLA